MGRVVDITARLPVASEPSYREMAAQLRMIGPNRAVKLRINEEVADLLRPIYTDLQDRLKTGEPGAWTKFRHELEPLCQQLEARDN